MSPSDGIGDDDLIITFAASGCTTTFTEAKALIQACENQIACTQKAIASAKHAIASLKGPIDDTNRMVASTLDIVQANEELAELACACLEHARLRKPDVSLSSRPPQLPIQLLSSAFPPWRHGSGITPCTQVLGRLVRQYLFCGEQHGIIGGAAKCSN